MSVRVAEGLDAGAVWHYGDPLREQRALLAGAAGVDLSHRPLFTISGADRRKRLNDITSQDFASLPPGAPTVAYILDAQGHPNSSCIPSKARWDTAFWVAVVRSGLALDHDFRRTIEADLHGSAVLERIAQSQGS